MTTDNPVILFGDVGPEVVKYSQIYDPDKDEYVLSMDEYAWDTTKAYYTRSYSNKTVTFTQKTGVISSDTPRANGWYEYNASGVGVSKGKYVPAVESIVVVDSKTDDYEERTLLIVKAVDENTLKATLVPVNYGTDGETSARTLDYGNDRFMLYYSHTHDTYSNIELTPDRKMMLYGRHYYMYELIKNGSVISSPTAKPETSTNALIPYVSATAERVKITKNNYSVYAGKRFDVLAGYTFRRINIPVPAEEGDTVYVPTLDTVYKNVTSDPARSYWLLNDDGSYTYLEPGTEEEFLYGKHSLTTATTLSAEDEYHTYNLSALQTTGLKFESGGSYYRKKSTATGCIGFVKLTLVSASSAKPSSTDNYVRVGDLISDKSYVVYGVPASKVWRVAQCGTSDQYAQGLADYYDGMATSALVLPFYEQVTGNVIANGGAIGVYNKDGVQVSVAVSKICNTAEEAFGEEGVYGWIDFDDSKNHVFYPDMCYLNGALTAGEAILMNVYEVTDDSRRLVMSASIIAKEADVSASTASSKRIASFDVNMTNDSTESGVWYVDQGGEVTSWVAAFKPTITYDDGSTTVVPVDNRSCFVYGLDNVNTTNTGSEFTILFKYFPEKATTGTFTQQVESTAAKKFLSCTKVIRVVEDATLTIRKISIFPVWNIAGYYNFRFAVYSTNMTSPPAIVDDLGTIVNFPSGSAASTRSMMYMSDLSELYAKAATEAEKNRIIKLANMMYMDDSHVVRPSTDPESNFGYIQHGTIAVYAKALGYTNAIYSQDLAVRLNNWLYNTVPVKWLIGDDTSAYDEKNMPYGNANTDIRPYIQYNGMVNATSPDNFPFTIGNKFKGKESEDPDCFIRAFYWNANPPAPNDEDITLGDDSETDSPTYVTPTHFRVRAFTGRTYYEELGHEDEAEDVAVQDVVYYTTAGKQVTVIPGVTPVHDYVIKCQEELDYYVFVGGAYVEVTGEDRPVAGTILTNEQRYSWFLKRETDIATDLIPISDWNEVNFQLVGAVLANSETGGSIPVIIGSNYNTHYMGNVVVEFVSQEGTDANATAKYLYGVPVEVRHPYQLTTDSVYVEGTDYYIYDETNNMFTKLTAGVDYTIGDTITSTPKAKYVVYQ